MPEIPHIISKKLERANVKSTELKLNIQNWMIKNPVSLYAELRNDRQGVVLKCNMQNFETQLDDWRLTFGEIIYTLRSSLENLIYYLADNYISPPKKPRNIMFPIFSNQKEFQEKAKSTLAQLSPSIRDLVEKIQPYHRQRSDVQGTVESDPLITLNFLSNLDKHRSPIIFLIPPKEINLQNSCEFYSEAEAAANIPPNVIVCAEHLAHGKVVLEYVTNCPIKKAEGKFEIKANVVIEVNGNIRELFEILDQLNWYVRLVIEEFKKP